MDEMFSLRESLNFDISKTLAKEEIKVGARTTRRDNGVVIGRDVVKRLL